MKEVVSYEMLNLYNFRKSSRLLLPELDPGEAIKGFREVEGAFTRTKAVRSARRCFNCGICSFCSNCYQFCPDLAIRIDVRERLRDRLRSLQGLRHLRRRMSPGRDWDGPGIMLRIKNKLFDSESRLSDNRLKAGNGEYLEFVYKCIFSVMPDLIRHPEGLERIGFRLAPE